MPNESEGYNPAEEQIKRTNDFCKEVLDEYWRRLNPKEKIKTADGRILTNHEIRLLIEEKIVAIKTIIPDIEDQILFDEDESKPGTGHNRTDSNITDLIESINEDIQNERRESYSIKFWELLKEKFSGQIVIDIGAGYGLAHPMIESSGARAYVGVEKFNFRELLIGLTNNIRTRIVRGSTRNSIYDQGVHKSIISVSVVLEGMLGFLKRLPDNSVSVFSSSIDGTLISDQRYLDFVDREIDRVLHKKGAFVAISSTGKMTCNEKGFCPRRI